MVLPSEMLLVFHERGPWMMFSGFLMQCFWNQNGKILFCLIFLAYIVLFDIRVLYFRTRVEGVHLVHSKCYHHVLILEKKPFKNVAFISQEWMSWIIKLLFFPVVLMNVFTGDSRTLKSQPFCFGHLHEVINNARVCLRACRHLRCAENPFLIWFSPSKMTRLLKSLHYHQILGSIFINWFYFG